MFGQTQTKADAAITITLIVCGTLSLMGALAGMIYMVTQYPNSADVYLRPLIPSLVMVASAIALWIRGGNSRQATHRETSEIKELVTNGNVDTRIEAAVTRALQKHLPTGEDHGRSTF